MTYIRIPEQVDPDRRLGRHLNHDPRSLRYLAPAGDLSTLKSVRHQRMIPVLDQGDVGACTGFAAEGALGTSPLYDALAEGALHRPTGDAVVDEGQALALYSTATALDDYEGEYPPEDTGSSGLAVAKAALSAGLISGYRHATSLEAALTALAEQPVIAGINWYDSFDSPNDKGIVWIPPGAQVRGGHEICVDELLVDDQLIGFTNSWGSSWGKAGRAYMKWNVFARLLSEDGDVTVFTPLTQPAPTPAPPQPDPSDSLVADFVAALRQAWAAFDAWLKGHGL